MQALLRRHTVVSKVEYGEQEESTVIVDGLPVVPAEKIEKLKNHLKKNPRLLTKWKSKPKYVIMPARAQKSQGAPRLTARASQPAAAAARPRSCALRC